MVILLAGFHTHTEPPKARRDIMTVTEANCLAGVSQAYIPVSRSRCLNLGHKSSVAFIGVCIGDGQFGLIPGSCRKEIDIQLEKQNTAVKSR